MRKTENDFRAGSAILAAGEASLSTQNAGSLINEAATALIERDRQGQATDIEIRGRRRDVLEAVNLKLGELSATYSLSAETRDALQAYITNEGNDFQEDAGEIYCRVLVTDERPELPETKSFQCAFFDGVSEHKYVPPNLNNMSYTIYGTRVSNTKIPDLNEMFPKVGGHGLMIMLASVDKDDALLNGFDNDNGLAAAPQAPAGNPASPSEVPAAEAALPSPQQADTIIAPVVETAIPSNGAEPHVPAETGPEQKAALHSETVNAIPDAVSPSQPAIESPGAPALQTASIAETASVVEPLRDPISTPFAAMTNIAASVTADPASGAVRTAPSSDVMLTTPVISTESVQGPAATILTLDSAANPVTPAPVHNGEGHEAAASPAVPASEQTPAPRDPATHDVQSPMAATAADIPVESRLTSIEMTLINGEKANREIAIEINPAVPARQPDPQNLSQPVTVAPLSADTQSLRDTASPATAPVSIAAETRPAPTENTTAPTVKTDIPVSPRTQESPEIVPSPKLDSPSPALLPKPSPFLPEEKHVPVIKTVKSDLSVKLNPAPGGGGEPRPPQLLLQPVRPPQPAPPVTGGGNGPRLLIPERPDNIIDAKDRFNREARPERLPSPPSYRPPTNQAEKPDVLSQPRGGGDSTQILTLPPRHEPQPKPDPRSADPVNPSHSPVDEVPTHGHDPSDDLKDRIKQDPVVTVSDPVKPPENPVVDDKKLDDKKPGGGGGGGCDNECSSCANRATCAAFNSSAAAGGGSGDSEGPNKNEDMKKGLRRKQEPAPMPAAA